MIELAELEASGIADGRYDMPDLLADEKFLICLLYLYFWEFQFITDTM